MNRARRSARAGLSSPVLALGATLAAVLVGAVSFGGARATAAAAATSTTTVTFAAAADARLEEAHPATSFGTSTRLASDGDAGLRIESVLRFQLSGISGTVEAAKLRLYVVSDATVEGPAVYPARDDWVESGVTWDTRPSATGLSVANAGSAAVGRWVELDVTPLVRGNGSLSLLLRQEGTDGVQFYAREGAYKPELVVSVAEDPVVMAVGDIACKPGAAVTAITCHHQATADLVQGDPAVTQVLTLGDHQYDDGLLSEFTGAGAYDATWGSFKSITKPTPGNHEYHTAEASGYFDYFGDAAGERGKGYYSFDVGSWHLVALNSDIAVAEGSLQEQWLKSDLALTRKKCILAYWHKPLFSSGRHGGMLASRGLWDALYTAHADVVLNGHDHDYERFAPQDPSGQADPNGIREFVVGTGGAYHSAFIGVAPNSEVRDANTFGVLRLTLQDSSYEWKFVPEAGGTFTDSGSGDCHESAPAAAVTVNPSAGLVPVAITADASGSTDTDGSPIASYSFDFGDGSPLVGPQAGASAAHTYAAPGTYTVTVTVTDTGGRSSTATAQVVAKASDSVVRNGGFETDTSGWNTGGSGPNTTLTRAAGGHTGLWAAQLANGGSTASTCTLNDSPNWLTTTAAGAYTATLWVRADAPGATLKLRLREWVGTTLAGTAAAQVTLTPSWQQVTVLYTVASPGSTLDYSAYVVNAAPGNCFYADDAGVYAQDSPPAAVLTVSPQSGREPLTVTADASASTDGGSTPIDSYTFDFGDGSPAVGPQAAPTATHTYTAGGAFVVTVTVKDTAGQASSATVRVAVEASLVRNPGFEADTAGWNTSGSGANVALARASGGHTGDFAAQLANSGTTASTCTLNDSPNSVTATAAGTYTGSLWARADVAGATLKLRFREWAGTALAGSAAAQVTLTTSWQQVTVRYTTASPGSTLDFNAYVVSAAPGTCFYADDASIFRD